MLVPTERIEQAILQIRGQKVMLDSDLAELLGVQTKVLNPSSAGMKLLFLLSHYKNAWQKVDFRPNHDFL